MFFYYSHSITGRICPEKSVQDPRIRNKGAGGWEPRVSQVIELQPEQHQLTLDQLVELYPYNNQEKESQ